EDALKYHNQALNITREIGNRSWEATTLNNIGLVYANDKQTDNALKYYNLALSIVQEIGDPNFETAIANNINFVYRTQAQDLLDEVSDLYQQGTKNSLEQAIVAAKKALPLWIKIEAQDSEALTNLLIGRIYYDLGKRKTALEYYNKALVIYETIDNNNLSKVYGIAIVYNAIGLNHLLLGETQTAINYFNNALSLLDNRELNAEAPKILINQAKAGILGNLASSYSRWGETQRFFDNANEALNLIRQVGDNGEESVLLNNIDVIYAEESVLLNNIGFVYQELGDINKALEIYKQALPLAEQAESLREIAIITTNIGWIYSKQKEYRKARQQYNEALPLFQKAGDIRGEAIILFGMGELESNLGNYEIALEQYNQALPLMTEVGEKLIEAYTFYSKGKTYENMDNYSKALKSYEEALSKFRTIKTPIYEAMTLGTLASLETNEDNLDQALSLIKMAVEIMEDVRTKVVSPELRQIYFSSVYEYYQLYIDILMELHEKDPNKGYDAQAFTVSERSRARTLIELLTEANADIEQGIDPKLKEEEQSLRFQINAAEKQKLELFIKPYPDKMDRFTVVQEKLDTLNAQYQDLKNRIRATSPRYAALQFPQPLTLAEVQNQVLDTDTTLLQFALGEERSYVWVVTKDTMKTYLLPQSADIEAKVTAFSQWLGENPDERDSQQGQTAGQELSEMLFSQFATELTKKRLVIVSDGALHNIPFAALPFRQNSTLINNYEIVHLPSS
ncbi:MAG: CHAT domain-containing protein, partial [Saprospiraceae bacterium]|nr:CHAT domain-containing protein [Saprospiraceae bacterium]